MSEDGYVAMRTIDDLRADGIRNWDINVKRDLPDRPAPRKGRPENHQR
jgi:hypothetical protein